MKIIQEFKQFAMRGNVIDMAVGIIIGASFGKIVTSFVNDILMPPLGVLLGGVDFSNKTIVLRGATETAEAITLRYGFFVNTVIDFVIVAAAIFFMVKLINRWKKEEPNKASTTKECPYCYTNINIKATRCSGCASPLIQDERV